jgi:nucleotide-binding universal stress UspA family protein
MKRILIPTNFSDLAHNAIDYAVGMFSYDNVEYILLNTYMRVNTGADMMIYNTDLGEESKKKLSKELEYVTNKYPSELLNIESMSEYGSIPTAVNKICESVDIDYVVMGTKGASGLKRFFFGSNVADVVEDVKCPVLVVPEDVKYKPPIKIAFATDYHGLEDKYFLSPLSEMALQYQSELSVVNVNTEEYYAGERNVDLDVKLHPELDKVSHKFFQVWNSSIVNGLNTFIDEHDLDMLAMIAREHGLLSNLLGGSVTKELSMLTKIPLLILHEK